MSEKIHNHLIVFFIFISGVLFFALPAFQVPDEEAHWNSANIKIDGLLGIKNHCHALTKVWEFMGTNQLPSNPNNKVNTGTFSKTPNQFKPCDQVYTEVDYSNIFTYLNVFIARLIISDGTTNKLSAAATYYLSKLIGFFFVLASLLRSFALYRSLPEPEKNKFNFATLVPLLIILIPIVIQQSIGITADQIVILASIWIVIFLLFYPYFKWFDYFFLATTSIVASSSKTPFVPFTILPALYFLFHHANFELSKPSLTKVANRLKTHKRSFIFLLLIFLLSLGAALKTSINVINNLQLEKRLSDIDSRAQAAYIKSNPLKAISAINNSVQKFKLSSLIGSPLGWLDTRISLKTINLHNLLFYFLFLVWLSCLVFEKIIGNSLREIKGALVRLTPKIIGCALFFILVLSINQISNMGSGLALYLSWTPPGADHVQGLQARYFIGNHMIVYSVIFHLIHLCLINFPSKTLTKYNQSKPFRSNMIVTICYFIFGLYLVYLTLDLYQRFW